MRPLFIYLTKKDGSNTTVNANAIVYYNLIGLGPGMGTELFFSNIDSIETIHGPQELEKLIRAAIEECNNPLPKFYSED